MFLSVVKVAVQNLTSSKVTERKKAAKDLSDSLNKPDCVEAIHAEHNDREPHETSFWSKVYIAAHHAVLLETEKAESKGNLTAAAEFNLRSFAILVASVIKKANEGEIRLPYNEILSSCVRVLREEHLCRLFGQDYLTILLKNFLTVREYTNSIKKQEWIELLSCIVRLWDDSAPKCLKTFAVLETLRLIVFYGTAQSHLSLQVKTDLIPVLVKNKQAVRNPSLSEAYLKLAHCVCSSVALECRTLVCYLGEIVLSSALEGNDLKLGKHGSTKSVLSEFLLFQIRCHHPGGAREGSDAAYACNWITWNKCLSVAFRLTMNELLCANSNADYVLPTILIDLGTELCQQVFYRRDSLDNEDDLFVGPAAKRRKISYKLEGILDEIYTTADCRLCWQWLILLSSLINRYPKCLKEQDFQTLLNNLVPKMNKCKEPVVMGYIFSCCESLLHVDHLFNSSNDLWLVIWDTTLRTVGLNQNEEEGHSLLRAMVFHGRMPAVGVEALLKLYKSQTLRRSDNSVKTLFVLCSIYPLPDSVESTQFDESAVSETVPGAERALMLNWLLPIEEAESTIEAPTPKSLAEAVAPLILKSQTKNDAFLNKCDKCSDSSRNSSSKFSKLEQDYIASSFDSRLLVDPPDRPTTELEGGLNDSEETVLSKLLDRRAKDHLDSIVKSKCEVLHRKADQVEPGLTVSALQKTVATSLELISKADFLFCTISTLSKHGVITEQNLDDWSLAEGIKVVTEDLGKLACKIITVQNKQRTPNDSDIKVLSVMTKLKDMFENNVRTLGCKSLHTMMKNDFIAQLLCVVRDFNSEDKSSGDELHISCDRIEREASNSNHRDLVSDLHAKYLPVHHQLGIICAELLCVFLSLKDADDRVRRTLWSHLSIKTLDQRQTLVSTFLLVLTCARYAVSKTGLDKIPKNFPDIVQSLCRQWHSDAEATILIIELLKDITKLCKEEESTQLRQLVVIDVKAFLKKECGPRFTVALIQCFHELHQVDPESEWSRWEVPENRRIINVIGRDTVEDSELVDEAETEHVTNYKSSLLEELVFYMASPFFEVRVAAVKHLTLLLAKTSNKKQFAWQKTLLARSFCAAYSLFSIQKRNTSTEEKIDEAANRTATVIHFLTSVVVSSSMWRKDALRFLVFLVKEKNISINLVQKALLLIKERMQLKNVNDLLLDYFDFLLEGWIKKKFDLLEFPFQLFGSKSIEEFLTEMENRIMPVLLITNKYEIIESVCVKTGRELKEVFKDCFTVIVARILPIFAANGEPMQGSNAHRVYNHCHQALTKEGVSRMLRRDIDSIVENITKLLWDPTHCECLFGPIPLLPEMPGNWISYGNYLKTLEYLQKSSADPETELLVLLGRSRPIVIQRVMLKLRLSVVSGSNSLDRRILALYQYCAFVQKLSEHLREGQYYDVTEFFIRDVSHTLLHLLRSGSRFGNGSFIPIASCKYLQAFYEGIVPKCSEVIQRLLPTLVSVLVPIAQKADSVASSEEVSLAFCCSQLLQLLIVSYAQTLAPTIAHLPSFPEGFVFDDMRQIHADAKYKGKSFSLEEEIQHFLCSVDVSLGKVGLKCPLEGLQFLRAQLSERKGELHKMYQALSEIRGFSEECAQSSLHQLICVFARLSSTGSNKKVRLEAACCLGELGMTNLKTLILRPESHHATAVLASADTHPLYRLAEHAVGLVTNYLFDEDVQVVDRAATALLALLATFEGNHALASNQKGKKENQDSSKLMRNLVRPFLADNLRPAVKQIAIDEEVFSKTVDLAAIWYPDPDSKTGHAEWVVRLTTALLRTFSGSCEFLHQLVPLCRIKVAFAEELLPLVLSLVLSCEKKACHQVLSGRIAEFFRQHSIMASSNSARGPIQYVCMNQASVQCMLNAVHLMRIQQGLKTCLKNPYLELNYLHVAKAAQFCAAYFSSVMYAELWFEVERRRAEMEQGKIFGGFQSLSPVDYLSDENSEDGRTLQALLFEAYTRIGDTDAVYGCGSSFILDPCMRMSHCKEMGFWEEILNNTNFILSREPDMTASLDLVAALGEGNLLHVQDVYLQSTLQTCSENTAELKPHLLECLWRLGRWDVPLQVQSMEKAGFEWHQFAALRNVHHGNALGAIQQVEDGRLLVMSQLAHASLESCASIYKPLTKLQALQEIEDAVKAITETSVESLLVKWEKQDSLGQNAFPYARRILEQRSCILQSVMSLPEFRQELPVVRKALTNHMLHTVRAANTEGKPQVAKGFLQSVRNIPQQNESTMRRCRLEEAKLEWNLGNGTNNYRARLMLRSLLNDLVTIYRGSDMDTILYADVLRLYGTWMAETRNEQPRDIIEKYFQKAIQVLESVESEDAELMRLETHTCMARYADQQYQRLAAYLSSDKFESKKQLIELMQSASKALQKTTSKDDRKALYVNSKNSELDKEEVITVYRQREFFLDLALKSYAQTLLNSEKENLLAFRLLSLWLNNPQKSETVAEFLISIPSHKFVPLLCQISAHLSDHSDSFPDTISSFLEKCALDHPHHALPVILALSKSYEDRIHIVGGKEIKKRDQEPRVRGAINLAEKLSRNERLSGLVRSMEDMFSALISLAYVKNSSSKEGRSNPIPKDQKILRLKNLYHVLLPTVSLPVRIDRKYDDIVGIYKFEEEYGFVGGINAPKKVTCKGTDGQSRPILVKGQDDLRQDAVMQQVFAVMNTLLSTSKETQQRRLKIRTYKVVPLSQRSGIIEWCVNTSPLEVVLSHVHSRYYPKDWTFTTCRSKLETAAKKGIPAKLAAYDAICKSFHPAFRYHFLEKYQTPSVWFERRLAYVHSVATTSMVGYILGLGDRHVQNILLDMNTAEVVHIDFGIAFEQGRILPTPETVPFRLTRDIEDGMGLSGIEGVFRRSCEKTMTVLRRSEGTILAILEVLLYDPLFEWTKTPKKVAMRQLHNCSEASVDDSIASDSSTEVNAMAERALSRLHQKLQGTEEGSASSIEGQVNRLIQEARDPTNLCQLFPGWKPFL